MEGSQVESSEFNVRLRQPCGGLIVERVYHTIVKPGLDTLTMFRLLEQVKLRLWQLGGLVGRQHVLGAFRRLLPEGHDVSVEVFTAEAFAAFDAKRQAA